MIIDYTRMTTSYSYKMIMSDPICLGDRRIIYKWPYF